jgi:hypothetical protein
MINLISGSIFFIGVAFFTIRLIFKGVRYLIYDADFEEIKDAALAFGLVIWIVCGLVFLFSFAVK